MKQPKLIDKTVYLAAPKRLLSSDLYDRAFRFLLAQSKGVMNPQWMFKDNADWLANMDKALSVCDVMVIVTDDNFVGKGVFVEYQHFVNRFCDVYYYVEDEEFVDENYDGDYCTKLNQELVTVKHLVIEDENNWKDYATVKH
jgi:hypothetical protein